jgi:hypothetical protein
MTSCEKVLLFQLSVLNFAHLNILEAPSLNGYICGCGLLELCKT